MEDSEWLHGQVMDADGVMTHYRRALRNKPRITSCSSELIQLMRMPQFSITGKDWWVVDGTATTVGDQAAQFRRIMKRREKWGECTTCYEEILHQADKPCRAHIVDPQDDDLPPLIHAEEWMDRVQKAIQKSLS